MPEESANSVAAPQNKKSFLNPLLIIAFVLLILIVSGALLYFVRNQNTNTQSQVQSIEKEKIRLGWGALTGVYPKNSSPPTTDDTNVNDSIFEALTKVRGSTVVPSLATKWTNPSSTVWRFEIRKGVKFQTGQTLTADDVKYSFDQVLATVNDDNPWPSANSVATIKSVTVVDPNTVEIETTDPDPILLNRITDVFILSKSQIATDGLDKASGTGPFKVSSYETDKKAVVVRNDAYWGTKPKVKEADFTVYQSDQEMLDAIKKGDIDYAKVSLANVSVPTNYSVEKHDQPRVEMLFFNYAAKTIGGKPNPLLNKNVRLAVKDALDNTKLIKEASVSATAANQFLTRTIVGYNSNIANPSYSVTKSKTLLTDAGAANLSFSIYTTGEKEPTANAISKQLALAGITAKVVVLETFGDVVKKLMSGEAPAFVAGPSATDGGEYIGSIFKTDADQNILGYSNPDVDKKVAEANASFSPKERRALLEGLSQTIVDDVPVVPLYADSANYIIRKDFTFQVNSLVDFILESVAGKSQ